MTIVAISDDDADLLSLETGPVDVLISCGDLHEGGILRAMEHYKPRKTFAVKGNHDSGSPFPAGITDLHCATATFEGLRFGGFAGSWRYKPRGHHLFDQIEVIGLMRGMPAVDIFVAHNSPAGIHERDNDVHQGFDGFIDYLDRAQPKAFLHGHQHLDRTTIRGVTTIFGIFGAKIIQL